MKIDNPIFGLRFGSNTTLQPTHEELRLFLESRKKEGGRELHGGVLAAFAEVLEDVISFQRRQLHEARRQDVRERMFYGVLGHSLFFNPALKSAVEQYKYHLHALTTLDFKKPGAFINAVEEAMSRLNPKKKDDATKLVKFRAMAGERKKLLETLTLKRAELVEELSHIAMYIRDNLVKIENRCETSIVVLADSRISRKKETQLIEDIKIHFKEQLKNDLRDGLVTSRHLEIAKRDVDLLMKEILFVLRDNFYSLTRLFEAIYDHTRKIVHDIDILMEEYQRKKNRSFEEDVALFTWIEQVLVALISADRFDLKTTEMQTETTHKTILLEKRDEMLNHLFELLQKERRSWTRRSREYNRRRSDPPGHKDLKRRSGCDRRAGEDRRRFASASL